MAHRFFTVDRGRRRELWWHDPKVGGYWRILAHAEGGLVNGDQAFSFDPENDPTLGWSTEPDIAETARGIVQGYVQDPALQPIFLASDRDAGGEADPSIAAANEQALVVPPAVPPAQTPQSDAAWKIEHNKSPALTADQRQMAIYGETASLYPHSLDPNGPHNDPKNWEADSWDNLQRARTYVGIVARRNGDTHWEWPDFGKIPEREVWNRAEEPAYRSADDSLLDPNITHFAIRGDGDPTDFFPGMRRQLTIGPFRKIGPADKGRVPPGNNAFVEFYGKP
jgi:hypothetical protein